MKRSEYVYHKNDLEINKLLKKTNSTGYCKKRFKNMVSTVYVPSTIKYLSISGSIYSPNFDDIYDLIDNTNEQYFSQYLEGSSASINMHENSTEKNTKANEL